MVSVLIALIGIVGTLGGVIITNHFNQSRWKLEQREMYKAELFKVKLEVYRELLAAYLEFVLETAESFRNNTFPESFGHIRKVELGIKAISEEITEMFVLQDKDIKKSNNDPDVYTGKKDDQ